MRKSAQTWGLLLAAAERVRTPGSPWPPVPAGLSEDEDVRAMLRGSRFCKIRSPTWQKERLYRLQEDGLSVWFQRRIPRAPSQHICERDQGGHGRAGDSGGLAPLP